MKIPYKYISPSENLAKIGEFLLSPSELRLRTLKLKLKACKCKGINTLAQKIVKSVDSITSALWSLISTYNLLSVFRKSCANNNIVFAMTSVFISFSQLLL